MAERDLWGGDQQLWDKISQSQEPAVRASVELILRYRDFVLEDSNPTVRLQPKIRTIDPDVVTESGIRPLSTLDPEYRDHRDNYLRTRTAAISFRLAG